MLKPHYVEASVCQSLSMSKPKYENENKAALAHLYSIWIHNKVTVQYILYNYYANYDVGFVCCPMSSHSINLKPVQVHASIRQFDSAYRLRIGIYRQCLLTMYIHRYFSWRILLTGFKNLECMGKG